MSQVACEITPPFAEESRRRFAWKAPIFAIVYGAALIAIAVYLTTLPTPLVLVLGVPAVAAATAIITYLLVISPTTQWLAALLLVGGHAALIGIGVVHYASLQRVIVRHEMMPGILFWCAIAVSTGALAYWDRRRYLRLQRSADLELQLQPPRRISLSRFDYVYLALVLAALAALIKWAYRDMYVVLLPAGMVIAALVTAAVRLGLAPSRRGYSPAAVIGMGLIFVTAGVTLAWVFYPQYAYLFLAVAGCPIALWSGLILTIRGDGYRIARDFSVIVDKAPVAEPDPLA